jgi:hypothetical protein
LWGDVLKIEETTILDEDLAREYAMKLVGIGDSHYRCTVGFLPQALHQSNQHLVGKCISGTSFLMGKLPKDVFLTSSIHITVFLSTLYIEATIFWLRPGSIFLTFFV